MLRSVTSADIAGETPEELWSDGCGSAVGAVHNNAQATQRKPRDRVDEELNVVRLKSRIVFDKRKLSGFGTS